MADEQLELVAITSGVRVTIMSGGLVVCGITITAGDFLRTSADIVAADARRLGTDEASARSVGDAFLVRAMELDGALERLKGGGEGDDDEEDEEAESEIGELLGFVHLRSITVVASAAAYDLPTYQVARFAVDRIDGFAWGASFPPGATAKMWNESVGLTQTGPPAVLIEESDRPSASPDP